MLSKNSWKTVSLAAILLLAAGCTNDSLDDGTSPDVILQVVSFESPVITAQQGQATQGTCSLSGTLCDSTADCALNETCIRPQVCRLEVSEWTATLQAAPKNSLATPPFNDVVMQTVDIVYAWANPGLSTPPATFGLGGVTIPAGATNQVQFFPVETDYLTSAYEGATAHLTMTFRGRTVEGTNIVGTVQRDLVIEVCQ
jgi:hypothetical protein